MRCKGKPKAHLQIRRVGHPEEKPKSRPFEALVKQECVCHKDGGEIQEHSPFVAQVNRMPAVQRMKSCGNGAFACGGLRPCGGKDNPKRAIQENGVPGRNPRAQAEAYATGANPRAQAGVPVPRGGNWCATMHAGMDRGEKS